MSRPEPDVSLEPSSLDRRRPAIRGQTRPRGTRWVRALAGWAIATAALVGLLVSGTIDGTQATLVVMGFDPDRAVLITALLAAAIVGAAAALATDRRNSAIPPGIVAFCGLYASTLVTETGNALSSSGSQGVFSAGGWLLTVVGLATAAVAAAWAGPTLAVDLRRAALEAAAVARRALVERSMHVPGIWRPVLAVVLVALVAIGGPVFGTLVNYAPDSVMLSGNGGAQPLVGGGGSSSGVTDVPGGARSSGPGASQIPGQVSSVGGGAPSGNSTIQYLSFTAPWRGGTPHADVTVYLPAGYASSTRRYPVIYEAPMSFGSWDGAIHVTSMLDSLTASGQLTPSIVVFVASNGGPFPDSECINSYDGREWFDTYVTQTVVPYVDSHYHTIASAGARTILGFSQGGFCAAMLQMRHPDVFGNAVVFNGYFQADPAGGSTASAHAVFGGQAGLRDAYSPSLLAPRLAAAVRSQLFVVLVGSEAQPFFGPQMTAYARLMGHLGVGLQVVANREPHSWIEVRHSLPAALGALSAHLTSGTALVHG